MKEFELFTPRKIVDMNFHGNYMKHRNQAKTNQTGKITWLL